MSSNRQADINDSHAFARDLRRLCDMHGVDVIGFLARMPSGLLLSVGVDLASANEVDLECIDHSTIGPQWPESHATPEEKGD